MAKIKSSLQRSLTDPLKSSKISFKLINPVSKSVTGQHHTQQIENFEETLVKAYEVREKQLREENEGLRSVLYESVQAVSQLLVSSATLYQNQDAKDTFDTHLGDDAGALAAKFQLPFDKVRFQVEELAQSAIDQLTRRLELVNERMRTTKEREDQLEAEVEQLKKQVKETRGVIEEQARLIDLSLDPAALKAAGSGRAGLVVEDDPAIALSLRQLDQERQRLQVQKDELEAERKQFTEAAIRLGRERQQFEKERDEWQTLKKGMEGAITSSSTKDVVGSMPVTPAWLRQSLASIEHSRILQHQTPLAEQKGSKSRGTPFSPFDAQLSRIPYASPSIASVAGTVKAPTTTSSSILKPTTPSGQVPTTSSMSKTKMVSQSASMTKKKIHFVNNSTLKMSADFETPKASTRIAAVQQQIEEDDSPSRIWKTGAELSDTGNEENVAGYV